MKFMFECYIFFKSLSKMSVEIDFLWVLFIIIILYNDIYKRVINLNYNSKRFWFVDKIVIYILLKEDFLLFLGLVFY